MTEKQKKFCDEYLIDFNGTQAAIRAGYSPDSATSTASEILTYPNVQEYLSERKSEIAERSQITKDQLIKELAKIAFFDIRKIYTIDGGLKNVNEFGDEEAAAIAGIDTYDNVEPDSGMILGTTKKVKVHPKIAAIERISKMLGFDAPEKREVNNTGQIIWQEVKNYDTDEKANEGS